MVIVYRSLFKIVTSKAFGYLEPAMFRQSHILQRLGYLRDSVPKTPQQTMFLELQVTF